MLSFTRQERIVLILLAFTMLVGSVLHFAFKKYPQLKDIVNFVDSDRIYHKVDINTASLEKLVAIPYIGPYTGQQIIEYRRKNGPFASIQEIKSVKGIKEKNYDRFSKYLKVSK